MCGGNTGNAAKAFVNTATGGAAAPLIGGSSSYKENLGGLYTGNWNNLDTPKPYDNSAELARQAEAERQGRIMQGQQSIDSQFMGFNDDFYNKYQTDYTGYYVPQLEDQYTDARKKLTLDLAKTGNLNSSFGINQMGKLKKSYDDQNTMITNQGINAVNDLRSNIDNSKSQLYVDNRNAADPGNAASAAAAVVGKLQPGLPQSPLANAFADFFSSAGNAGAIYGKNTINTKNNSGVQNYNGNSNYKIIN